MERLALAVLVCLVAALLGSRAAVAPAAEARAEEPGENELRISWFGHAFFLVESAQARVAIDPYNEGVGYPMPDVAADVVLVTHGHADHNNVGAVTGDPIVIQGTGEHEAAGMTVKGVGSKHYDDEANARRGDNTVFVWQQAGIRVAHCGDLGHVLSDAEVAEIGSVDVLMVPVGGFYTVDAQKAKRVVDQLKPRVILPMHYLTEPVEAKGSPLAGVDVFLSLMEDEAGIDRPGERSITLSAEALPQEEPHVVVLSWR